MNTRITQIRKDAGLSQSKFAEKLNLSRTFISLVETGDREVSRRTISDICKIFNVNETWLLTGEGEKNAPLSSEAEIAQIAADIFHEEDAFRKKLYKVIADLNEDQLETLKDVARKLAEAADQK